MTKQALADQAAAIAPCDLDQPYYYISYSTREGETVYQTVAGLQAAGANLWIDTEANLVQGDGYNSSIFKALASPKCQGIIFFMSQAAMTSAQCAKELNYLKSNPFLANHAEDFPLILVELEEIDAHDDEKWVEGLLYQTYQDDNLSAAEESRIEKYREKYNPKIARLTSKYDVAKSILPFLLAQEAGRVSYGSTDPVTDLRTLLK